MSPRPLIALLAVALLACSHTTPGRPASGAAPSVNVAQLDPGGYPTSPLPALGDAGSEQTGRLVEGRRMAAFVVGPWQVDASLTAPSADAAAVLTDFKGLARVVWTPIVGGAHGLPFLLGFTSERQTPGPDPQLSLRNAVLRFDGDAAAAAAAHGMVAAAMAMPRVPSVTPIVTEPERALAIPGHPEAVGALLTFQEGAQTVHELTVLTARGPFVLVQVVRCPGTDCQAPLAGRTLDLQLPLLDSFQPTAATQFATLPQDPTGLVARTLPLPADQAASTSGAAYPLAGALHLDDNPIQAGPALTAAGVDYVSVNMTTVYQAKDPASAQTLSDALAGAAAATPAAQAAAAVPGLPKSRCTRVAGPNGLVPRYWCVTAVGRYTVKAVARQLDRVQQQTAAQYRMLSGPG